MRFLKSIGFIILIIFLTALTQIGGVILLLCTPLFFYIKKKIVKSSLRRLLYITSFLLIYLSITFFIIPPIAKSFGRVPLPINSKTIKPLNIMTCILNRHYAKPKLKSNITNVSVKFNEKFPNTTISYLDANFPFFNGFSLLPHLSHNDGKKVDVAFFYKDKSGKEINNNAPSFIGYGVYEEPKANEYNMPENCRKKGYWQYSILEKLVPQWNKSKMIFDKNRTKYLIKLFTQENTTSKIFIEPHLKTRMSLNSNKIRFHGCRAVRHDDHIHLQIK